MSLCRADKVLLAGTAIIAGSATVFGASSVSVGVPAALFAAVLADGVFRPSSGTFYPTLSHGPRTRPEVALTFDDGPHPEVTPRVLDSLAAFDARATFFMIGQNLERATAIGARAAAEGHQIGNHSWAHSYLQNFFSVERLVADMERTQALIRSVTGRASTAPYRAPVGLKSPRVARAAHALSLDFIAWSVHSRDTIDADPERIAARVLRRVRPGDIVLLHDGHQRSGARRTSGADALPLILRGLRERGLAPVTVETLLRPHRENPERHR